MMLGIGAQRRLGYDATMAKPGPASLFDDRQPILFDALPVPPPRRSDERALADIREMLETLAAAKIQPWSERLLGWQRRRFAALAQLLTPIEAAALMASFEAELDRLGPPVDIWAEPDGI